MVEEYTELVKVAVTPKVTWISFDCDQDDEDGDDGDDDEDGEDDEDGDDDNDEGDDDDDDDNTMMLLLCPKSEERQRKS